MNHLKPLAAASCITLTALSALLTPALTHAAATGFEPTKQILAGTAYMTYNQAVWATLKPESFHTDVHGDVLNGGAATPTADAKGQRYLYPQLFADSFTPAALEPPSYASDAVIANGTADPKAVAQWRILNPAEQVPAVAPAGGWAMPIDSLNPGLDDGFAPGYVPSSAQTVPDSSVYKYFISLGGSLRITSDFIGPSASLWLRGLGLSLEVVTTENGMEDVWFIGSNASIYGSGNWFELIDPVFGLDKTGWMTMEADYKIGNAGFGSMLGLMGDNRVLGHISINPSAVPVPAAGWLLGSALFGLVGLRRRKNVGWLG